MKIKLDDLFKYIGLSETPESWRQIFEKISFNTEYKWLTVKESEKILDFYKIDNIEFRKKYFEAIDLINDDKWLKMTVYLFHNILYLSENYDEFWKIKTVKNTYKKHGNLMINVIALLSGYEKHLKLMKDKNYDKYQIDQQIKNVRMSVLGDFERFGIYGIRFSQMVWGAYFINGNIIQCGLLQYEIKTKCPSSLIGLIEDVGNYAYIHIPRGGKLEIIDVIKSIETAKRDIVKYFSNIDISKLVFYTKTWLLSDDLDDILDSNTNIMKFKKIFKIIKQEENLDDFLDFVFNCGIEDKKLNELPEKTIIQRKLKEKISKGILPKIGVGILK